MDMEIGCNLAVVHVCGWKEVKPTYKCQSNNEFKQAFSRMLAYWGRRGVTVSCHNCATYKTRSFFC
jgi:hypothetical protein